MSTTYTSAASRTTRVARARRWQLGWPDAWLAIASLVALMAVALASARAIAQQAGGASAAINLNTLASPQALEPALSEVISDPTRRTTIAGELFRFIAQTRETQGTLPNVGALARARLLTPGELALLKPHVTVRTADDVWQRVLLFGFAYVLGFQLVSAVWRWRGVRHDAVLLLVVHLLTALGLAALVARPDPLRDSFLMGRYTEGILIGLALMIAASLVDFRRAAAGELSYLPLLAALSLSVALLLFGSGPSGSAAKVNLGPVQPIEAIRFLLGFFLAGYFARRWELLRGVPRAEYVLPVAAGVGIALFFFFLQKDLGPALYTCCVFLAVYAIARGRTGLAVAGLGLLALGFYAGHVLQVSQTLANRVSMWLSPWDNGVPGGDQIAHALWGMSTGGIAGTGLGLGDTRYLPAGHTDLILAAIGEEQGALGLLAVAGLYGVLAWRGFRIGRLAHTDYGFFLATTMTLFLIAPVFIMASGVIGAAPLTGVVTPFLSYGGSAMVTNLAAIGVLASIHADRRPPLDFAPFRMPMRSLTGVLAAAAAGLLALIVDVQVVRADAFAVKPHRGVQADGGRRYVYNPRVLDLVRQIPRGTIYDRRGLPLATDAAGVVGAARAGYGTLGISLADACPDSTGRCYPLGGRAFHVLGDATTRWNWSAPNSSYVERDSESTLRGFDDRAVIVDGAVRRDYSEIVPLLRSRKDADALAAFLTESRDVRLTIDAALQLRTASIVANYAKRSGGRGAAIVLDPGTGDVLASVSYPWPEERLLAPGMPPEAPAPEEFLDRARYGVYPPGSTFKLVTASAALREHGALQRTAFACSRLPDGRVGARLPGWGRPVRDDVLDTHPHGTIDLHDGLVRSCNAYFAQLALKLGPAPLMAAAAELGIALTQAPDARERVRGTLPQVGYGQGDVLATPLRMARVAAAVAADGRLREPRWSLATAASKPVVFLEPDAARLLGRYMRDAVLTGTGRSLRDHPWRIAGKTGTAEVAGKPSHSWFVGYAPFGPATRRIAFAVILENAGYGGATAAPAAGEIVAAAAAAGLLK